MEPTTKAEPIFIVKTNSSAAFAPAHFQLYAAK